MIHFLLHIYHNLLIIIQLIFSCELWCGGDTGGGVSIYRLVTGIGAAGAQELACPVPPVSTNSRVLHAVAGVNTVYTYLYPGIIYFVVFIIISSKQRTKFKSHLF